MTTKLATLRIERPAPEFPKTPDVIALPLSVEAMAWRNREAGRFASGEYPPLPWGDADWWIGSAAAAHHFAHASVEAPGMLAYTPDERFGREDRQLRVKPGRYLKKHFPELSATTIQALATEFRAAFDAYEIRFAWTSDEIELIYLNGPHSCMAHETGDYETGGIHPTRAWGAGDLALAYIPRTGAPGAAARAVVYPAAKAYLSIYGDGASTGDSRLYTALIDAGYEKATPQALDGARLLALPILDEAGENSGRYALPYFDTPTGATLSECGHFFRMDHTSKLRAATGGVVDVDAEARAEREREAMQAEAERAAAERRAATERETRERRERIETRATPAALPETCDKCGDAFAGMDSDVARGARTIGADIRTPDVWCGDCIESDARLCENCERYTPDDEVRTVSGDDWCETCADDEALYCERCEDCFSSDETRTVNGDDIWCEDCTNSYASACYRCDSLYSHEAGEFYTVDGDENWCSGCVENGDAYWCERCEEYSTTSASVDSTNWCECCASNYSTYCDRCEERFSDDSTSFEEIENETVCAECACEANTCEHCEDRTFDDDMTDVSGADWCDNCASDDDYAATCSGGKHKAGGRVDCGERVSVDSFDADAGERPLCEACAPADAAELERLGQRALAFADTLF